MSKRLSPEDVDTFVIDTIYNAVDECRHAGASNRVIHSTLLAVILTDLIAANAPREDVMAWAVKSIDRTYDEEQSNAH